MRQVEMEERQAVQVEVCCRDSKRLLHDAAVYCYTCGRYIRYLYEPEDLSVPDDPR